VKIRVLEILASLRRAGAERVAVSIACGLDAARFETEVVSLKPAFPGGFEAALEERGIATRHMGKRDGLDPRMWPRIEEAIRKFRPDIVHTHSYVMRYALPAWAVARRGRIVHTVHNVAEREVEALGRAIHRVAFRAGALPVAISNDVARSFEKMYGFAPTATIPNGADTERGFRPEAREAWRRTRGFAADEFLVASVARFEPQKNPLGLIDSFARAFAGRPEARLVMAGEGSLLEPARRRAADLGVERRVYFNGLCVDVAELLSACDLFVLASDWEGSSVAVIEAMAARLPVVATAVGGVAELVEAGVTGTLVPAGDRAALAAAMAEMAGDAEQRRDFGEAGARKARQFDTSAMVERYGAFFERVWKGQETQGERVSHGTKRQTTKNDRLPHSVHSVAMLTTGLAKGGAEAQVFRLSVELKRRGWDVAVISMLPGPPQSVGGYAEALQQSGVEVVSLGMREGVADPRGFFRLAWALKRLRPRILHSHMFHANLLARAARLACPVPVVISTLHSAAESRRGDLSGGTRRRDRLYRWSDPMADAVVAVSRAAAERHLACGAARAGKTRVIPNGVDTKRFRPDAERRGRVRQELGLRDEFAWLAAGRLMWKKDYATMLRAFTRTEGAKLLIAGAGPQEAELKALAAGLGVDTRVRFLGQVEDVAGLMNAADGFVMSSVVEGLPVALLEAAASGVPVVATDAGGVREAVGWDEGSLRSLEEEADDKRRSSAPLNEEADDERRWSAPLDEEADDERRSSAPLSGFVVPAGDAGALGAAMRRMMALPAAEREGMARAARAMAVARFDFGVVVSEWEAAYGELLENARRWM
jgi:glycosyltransferase involved in cell wall biosynthesis